MTAIWFILAFMTGAAVLALLWPLSRRKASADASAAAGLSTQTRFYEDQLAEIERDLGRGLIAPAEAESARAEAARRLLRASRETQAGEGVPRDHPIAEPHLRQRRAASAFALSTIPLVALFVYGHYGSPDLPSQTEADRKAARSSGQELMAAIGQIEARLASDPGDARGWSVIAPVYMRLGRFADAARAYEAVVRLKGEEAEPLASWGEALVANEDGKVPPEARKLFERAQALDPKAPKPQFYLARSDEQSGDADGAARRLEALVAQGPADAPWMALVRDALARVKGASAPLTESTKEESDRAPAAQAEADRKPEASGTDIQALPPAERIAAIRGMVEGLDRRLGKQGGSIEEWLRLVRSYDALGERDRAVEALNRGRASLSSAVDLARLEAQARALGLASTDAKPTDQAEPDAGTPRSGDDRRSETRPAEARPEEKRQAATSLGPIASGAAADALKAMPSVERDAVIRAMVASLDRRLSAKGGSADEWMRLVRSYVALGERPHAVQALDRARMALAANPRAIGHLDLLERELKLRTIAANR